MIDASLPAIEQVVPHRGPMLWLDRVCEGDDRFVVCSASVSASAPFVRAGKVAAVVVLEYMAQGAAALLGLQAHRRGAVPRGGFLVAVPTFELRVDELAVGDALVVRAEQVWPTPETPPERLVSLDCSVDRDGTTIALATLNVVRHGHHG
jgi:predicted hotdog family 3-hydroxylacyl-ACP dehydratase